MKTTKIIYLLNMVRHESIDNNADINFLYQKALDEDERVIVLKAYLNEFNYYHAIGNSLLERGRSLLDQLYADPDMALQTLQEIDQVNETIKNESDLCRDRLRSPEPFSDTITVIKKSDTIAYISALKQIAGTCVYLIALYSGLKPLKYLTWSDTNGIQELIYEINTKFIPALMSVERPAYSWVIQKKRLGGMALFGGDGFFLSYDINKNVDMLTCKLHKEPVGTHAFLNIDAFESDEVDTPFCWGIGNIVSISPNNALSFIQHNIVTACRSPGSNELSSSMPTPLECVKALTDNKPYCITPDELVSSMNQWYVGHEIAVRKSNHTCLFCGKHVPNKRLVCDSHFSTELK